jgi:hypothetical protein
MLEYCLIMTVAESFIEKAEHRDIVETYLYPESELRVELVTPSDPRVQRAIEIEIAAMADLHDPPEEVRKEFIPYNESSLFFLAFAEQSDGSEDDILCMGRVIPNEYDGKVNVNKTLKDVGSIYDRNLEEVTEQFLSESGCEDVSKVWDIATLGPSDKIEQLKLSKRLEVIESVINSFLEVTLQAWHEGEITHCTSFDEVNAHEHFMNIGFPYVKMFDLDATLYDSFGTGEGMIGQPAWTSMANIVANIKEAQTQESSRRNFFKRLSFKDESILEPPRSDNSDGVKALLTAAAVEGWSYVEFLGMLAGGEALEHAGAAKWVAAAATAAATTAETLGTSYLATNSMGNFQFKEGTISGKIGRKAAVVSFLGSLWNGAPTGVMLDQASGKDVSFRRRLFKHSIPYGVAVGGWVITPLPELAINHPPETIGAIGAGAVAFAVKTIKAIRK